MRPPLSLVTYLYRKLLATLSMLKRLDGVLLVGICNSAFWFPRGTSVASLTPSRVTMISLLAALVLYNKSHQQNDNNENNDTISINIGIIVITLPSSGSISIVLRSAQLSVGFHPLALVLSVLLLRNPLVANTLLCGIISLFHFNFSHTCASPGSCVSANKCLV